MGEMQYKFLLERLRPELTKQITTMRPPVTVEEKLSITLSYLAYGRCRHVHNNQTCMSETCTKNKNTKPF